MTTPPTLIASPHTAAPLVFISSTVRDLADLRAGIRYVLGQRGVNVLMSEASDFPLSGDRSAIEECLENIRNSDFYVLVVDKRRGSLYKPGVSVTRQELKVARESFASTGKPHHLLFIRRGVSELAKRRNAALLKEGVDDPRHLRRFIKEITHPGDSTVPNFLKEFGSFEEIMDSITTRLNLGRNIAESLARRSVYVELTRNLAQMVSRSGSGAMEKHAALTTIRTEFDFPNLPLTGTVAINERQRTRLVIGIIGSVKASFFETDAIRSAVTAGVFLDYDPTNGAITETRIHQALTKVLDDLKTLTSYDNNSWYERLLPRLAQPEPRQIPVIDLASVFAFANTAENLFNAMRQACWLLSGSKYGNYPVPRLPITPLGREAELNIRKERVQPWEVEELFTQDIHPFGARIPWELGERTRAQRLQQFLAQLREIANSDPRLHIDDAELRKVAEDVVNNMTAQPGEGLLEPVI